MRGAWVYLVSIATLCIAGAYIAHLRLSDIPDPAIGHSPKPPVIGKPRDKIVSIGSTDRRAARSRRHIWTSTARYARCRAHCPGRPPCTRSNLSSLSALSPSPVQNRCRAASRSTD